jgi:prepilin-type processing-associated H-X9-DG protein
MDSAKPTLVGSMKLLSNVCSTAKILYCPYDARPGAKPEVDFDKLTVNNISYSYVPNLLWQNTPDSILALDRIYSPFAGRAWPTNGNHKELGGNVLFNDGHVAWQATLPSALKDTNGKKVVLSP